MIAACAFVFALLMFKLGHEAFLTFETQSLTARASAGCVTALPGLLALIGMHGYLRRFVFSLHLIGDQIVIAVAGWFAPQRLTFHIADLTRVSYHDFAVNLIRAPWYRLTAGGRGFLIDANPRHLQLDPGAFGRLRQRAVSARKRMGRRRHAMVASS